MVKKIFVFPFLLAFPLYFISCSRGESNIVVFYTNDIHGYMQKDLSYASVAQMKIDSTLKGNHTFLVDIGDHISGSIYASYDKGETVVETMNLADYDCSTIGNHEFDYPISYLKEIMQKANYKYLSCNFYHADDQGNPTYRFTDGSMILNAGDVNIGFVGITTPECLSISGEEYFKGYTFLSKDNMFYEEVQKEVNYLKESCKYVIALAHLGIDEKGRQFSSKTLAKNTSGLDVIIDGHSHHYVEKSIVKNKDNKDVIITQMGEYFEKVGKLTIHKNSQIDVETITSYPNKSYVVNEFVKSYVTKIEDIYGGDVGYSNINFEKMDGISEKPLGDLAADSFYYDLNYGRDKESNGCDFTIVNCGGVRSNIKPGKWTGLTCKEIFVFNNGAGIKSVPGQTIRTLLEFMVRRINKKEKVWFGGFMQVCGIKFDVDENITSDIVEDENGNYISGPTKDHYKVSNIQIYDKGEDKYKDFDESDNYLVGGSIYPLNGGDGCTMLKDIELTYAKTDIEDYKILCDYIESFEKEYIPTEKKELSVIATDKCELKKYDPNIGFNYENPFGGSRIQIK